MKPKAVADGIAVWCSHDEIGDLEKAIENPRNPNKHPETQIKLLANIMKVQGWRNPITISKLSGFITKGAGRRKAALLNGWTQAPFDYQDYENEAAEYADLIADNRIAELAEPDLDLVKEILESIEGLDAELTGYNLDDLGIGEEPPEDPGAQLDKAEELQHEWKTEYGQVWEIPSKASPGKTHRLMCGDSTKEDDLKKLLNGSIPVVFSDPPYGIDVVKVGGSGSTKFGKVGGGGWVESSFYAPVVGDDSTDTARSFYKLCKTLHIKDFILWGGNYFTDFLPPSRCWVVWDKENTGNFADAELAWTSFDKSVKLYEWMWNGLARKGERSVEGKTRFHPTQKPVGLHELILNDFIEPDQIVLDGFVGSGTTMVACERAGRVCYGLEKSAPYVAVILQRCLDMGLEPKLAK